MEILSMAADYCPVLLPVVHGLNFPSTVSDSIFCEKLERLMNKQSADLPSWLKWHGSLMMTRITMLVMSEN